MITNPDFLKKLRAFTLLEVVLSITLLAIVFGFVAISGSFTQMRADLRTETTRLVSYLRLAQTKAESGVSDSAHGAHFDTDRYVLFEGDSYDVNDLGNVAFDLPGGLEIQNISLSGSGSDVIFTPPYGHTESYGTFDLYHSDQDESLTVTLSSIGTIDY